MTDRRGKKEPRSKVKAGNEKRPLAVAHVSTDRQPTSKPPPPYGKQRLSWRFAKADTGGPWCLGDCSGPTLHDIIAS
jgi:hypothetical protein